MELALKDIRRHLGKFLATIAGVALLLTIVLVMNGIYQGNIRDGVWLIDNTAADLWVVERGRGGPFNEASRIPLDAFKSVAATPGVTPGTGNGVIKSGYDVDLAGNAVVGPADCNAAPTNTDFTATAFPQVIGSTGNRGFNSTAAGTIFFDPAGGVAGTTPLQ